MKKRDEGENERDQGQKETIFPFKREIPKIPNEMEEP